MMMKEFEKKRKLRDRSWERYAYKVKHNRLVSLTFDVFPGGYAIRLKPIPYVAAREMEAPVE
jgi:hypothetical protein